MREFRSDRAEVRGTVLWLATEVDRELLRLMDTLSRYSLGDPEVEHDDLMLRLDLFWSQLSNFRSGAVGDRLRQASDAGDTLDAVLAALQEIEPDLMALAHGDTATGLALRDRLSGFSRSLHQISQRVDKAEQAYLFDVSFRTERSLWLLAGLLACMAVSCAVLIGFLMVETRRSRRMFALATEAESQVRAMNDTLELRVRDRTAALEAEIAEREAAQTERRRAEERFRLIFEAANVGNIVVDDAGQVEAANAAALRMFGYGALDLVGSGIDMLIPDWGTERAAIGETRGPFGSAGHDREFAALAGDGREMTVRLSVGEITQEGRRSLILSISDVTEQKRLEDQLARSQRMDAIGQLTGGVAHDFNNLLAIILGNLELLREMGDEEATSTVLLDRSIDAALRGSELTRNMLSFARRAPLEPTEVDLNQLVQNIKNWISRTLPSSIDVETSLLAGLWRIKVDASSAESALINLILNARDAMPDGGKLTIETSNVRVDDEYVELRGEEIEPSRYVLLAVSDTGQGIEPEDLGKVFDPFFTTKPVGTGTGLGLSMLDGFMRQSSGTARVYSEVGVGTTFELYFKALSGEGSRTRTRAEGAAPRTEGQGETLLVVEDNEGVLEVLRTMLLGEGYRVLSAVSGDHALEVFEAEPDIALVLTDIVMPGQLQGTQLAKELRARRPDLPVIFMSGYASEATVHGNGLRPEDVRLMKPVRRVELLAAVDRSLKPRGESDTKA